MKKLLVAALAYLLAFAPAFADSTINGLGAGAAVQSTDIFPAYQGANPATSVTAAQIKTFTSIQSNLNTSTDPTAANDNTQGYLVGSIWQNSSTGRIWIARSVATNNAVWTLLELSDHPGYITGNWYLPAGIQAASAGSAPGAGSIRLYPAYIKERITLGALGLRVTTVGAAGNIQAAIYANNFSTGRPTGAALVTTASMSTASAASINAAASVQLEPGFYWFASNCDNGTAIFDSVPSTSTNTAIILGTATQSNSLAAAGGVLNGVSVAQTFGTWPNLTASTFTEVVGSSSIPLIQFSVTSVP